MAHPLEPLLRENYPRIAKDLVAPLVDLLTEAQHAFGGDIEKLHILLMIALRTAEHRGASGLDLDRVLAGEMAELPSLATNVKSLSAGSGIPEETVRRKVRALVEDGLIRRRDHALSYTPKAVQAMEGVRRILIRAAAQEHDAVERLLAERG
ncbi:MAG TPA: hypothetical protein VLI41_04795 [Phenylobacterium sp.]|uniref:hypothetical protein n=1 Tax=Phenylobacterium sp. TaxID=1871053 RepID=UPI002C39624F|nr:hypothetical protein [Phenylobacterium sp.]HSV02503.1 hypothetical protein [Phenylobacterium sp.]